MIDRAIQVHGAAGVTEDIPLALMWAHTRALRIADGPDEVHKRTIAQRELRRWSSDEAGPEGPPTETATSIVSLT